MRPCNCDLPPGARGLVVAGAILIPVVIVVVALAVMGLL